MDKHPIDDGNGTHFPPPFPRAKTPTPLFFFYPPRLRSTARLSRNSHFSSSPSPSYTFLHVLKFVTLHRKQNLTGLPKSSTSGIFPNGQHRIFLRSNIVFHSPSPPQGPQWCVRRPLPPPLNHVPKFRVFLSRGSARRILTIYFFSRFAWSHCFWVDRKSNPNRFIKRRFSEPQFREVPL